MSASTAFVDAAAISANARALAGLAAPAVTCAVVKADGYGHGSVTAACAALEGGATWLAVAQVDEARVLRGAGIEVPILLLSELRVDEIDQALAMGLRVVVYRPETIAGLSARAEALGVPSVRCHLKVDTGMRRVGCEPDDAIARARQIVDAPCLELEGTMTHLAMADEPEDPTTDVQLDRFDAVLAALADAGIDPGVRHAANSAGTIAFPRSRYDLVRTGIALYGIAPAPAMSPRVDLEPALRWVSSVSLVKPVRAGEKVSYGHRHRLDSDTIVATVPVGYADGYRRRLGLVGGEVLVGGRRRPIVGVVTMDQFVVDLGPDGGSVSVGDEVVLLGPQGDEEISATELAGRLDTIGYEIVCAISPRVERRPA
jgi:alanine racemase